MHMEAHSFPCGTTVASRCPCLISLRTAMTRSPSSTCPPAESRKSTTRFKAVPYLATDARSSSATPATMSPDHSISRMPSAWLNSSESTAGACSWADAGSTDAKGRVARAATIADGKESMPSDRAKPRAGRS